jgi:sugar lactone lactonase YvrE
VTNVHRASVRRLIDFPLGVGESPVWDSRTGCLWFVDVDAPLLCRLDLESRRVARMPMPAPIGSLALTEGDEILVALQSGVFLFHPGTGRLHSFSNPEPGVATNRLNDGKTGPDGAFWVGSMHLTRPFQPTAALYRIDCEGRSTRVLTGVSVSNGLAWSPDGGVLYHSDSACGMVRAFDFRASDGTVCNARELVVLSRAQGIPDGAAVDRAGFYWSAGVTAGCINRISPDGEIVDRYELPLAFPTMPCFGGTNGKTVFVTSMARLGEVRGEGSLIAFDVEIGGEPIPRFGAHRSQDCSTAG